MFKKTVLVATAIGAMAAVSLPASASAAWKHHNTEIQENLGGSLTGNARFQSSLGGVECQGIVTAEFLHSQTTGQVQNYEPHPGTETTECKGLGGLSPCQVHNWTTSVPWTFHTGKYVHIPATESHKTTTPFVQSEPVLTVTTGETSAQYTGGIFCLIKKTVSTPGELIITPNQPNTITSGQLSGKLWQDIQTNSGTVHQETIQVLGSGELTELDSHTYSI